MSAVRGLLVVFEGGDGAGKSTQAGLLADWLVGRGVEVVRTHQPGDTPAGRTIRRLLLDPATDLSSRAEALLYAADKAQHLAAVVRPALARGAVVVCDRYVDSMVAYQGAGRVLVTEEVERIARWATEDLRPDLTVLLDADPADTAARLGQLDRLEAAGEAFHRRVRQFFAALAERDPAGYLVLDARRPREDLAAAVAARVGGLLEAGLSAGAGTVGP